VKKQNKSEQEKIDEEIQEELEKWDIVHCHWCGMPISMLDATLINDKYFVCKKGC
jgi:formylmethanofuran dehydrogenase subunit E